jgi:hypothetical protein
MARHGAQNARQVLSKASASERSYTMSFITTRLLGYVITNNRIGTEAGFFAPFPRFVSNVNRHLGGHWDYWTLREELAHRNNAR